MSLLAVIALTAGYEAVREGSRRYEDRHAKRIEGLTRKYYPIPKLTSRVPLRPPHGDFCGEGDVVTEMTLMLCSQKSTRTKNEAHSCGQGMLRKRRRRLGGWWRLLFMGCRCSTLSLSC